MYLNNKLRVPENIPLRWELIRGFGLPELIRSGVIVATVLICCIVICTVLKAKETAVIAVAVVLFSMFACVCFFGKMDQNQSIYDYLLRRRRFLSEQQVFLYKHRDEVLSFVKEEKR